MEKPNTVTEGDHVILKKGNSMKLYKILRKRKVFMEKKHFLLDAAIGHPYGTTWEVRHGGLVAVTALEQSHDIASQIEEGGADNRKIFDDQKAQKLDRDDITNLKEQGVTGQGIIDKLVENSATFNDRTVFSKAKYLKKKQDKHILKFIILRPSTRLLSELYFNKSPSKVVHLRVDTLAQMLTACNVQSDSRVMIVEQCQGLLVGAVMERMAGNGVVVQFHSEDSPIHIVLNAYNFPKQAKEILRTFPLAQVYPKLIEQGSDKVACDNNDEERTGRCKDPDSDSISTSNSENQVNECTSSINSSVDDVSSAAGTSGSGVQVLDSDSVTKMDVKDEVKRDVEEEVMMDTTEEVGTDTKEKSSELCDDDKDGDHSDNTGNKTGIDASKKQNHGDKRTFPWDEERAERRRQKREALLKTRETLLEKNMDTLLIASRFHPAPLLMNLIEFVAHSRPFAVYCSAKEPLVDCYVKLRERGGAINIRLSETWHRDYQVLPDRTHPLVMMSGTGGYLLTGIVVAKDEGK